MPFEVPTKEFDSVEHAKNKVLRANQLEVTTFIGGSRYSVEELQSILDLV